jgi:uroporphyrinogen-III synthase
MKALSTLATPLPLAIFGSDTGTGEELAQFIINHYNEWHPRQAMKTPLLFLVGEQRRDVIPRLLMADTLHENRKIRVQEIVVYSSHVHSSFETEFKQEMARTQSSPRRWVVVFSPIGCEVMMRVLNMVSRDGNEHPQASLNQTHVVTIGPTTRDYLQTQFGFEASLCAETPTPSGVMQAIRETIRK